MIPAPTLTLVAHARRGLIKYQRSIDNVTGIGTAHVMCIMRV